jgi:simple sugar transport system substrate-binding protein
MGICWEEAMKRRDVLKLAGGGILAGVSAMPRFAFAASQPSMVVIHKISGIPWVNLMKSGVEKAGKDFGINATLIGPTAADPAQQAKLIEDVIAQKVDVLGLVPLDVNVCAPLLARAHDAGIKIITLEGQQQVGRDWDVALADPTAYGEAQMKKLGALTGGEGEYVIVVGGLTTPLHKAWADAAVAYQEKNFPKMKQATERFGMGESTDETQAMVLDVLKAHPKVNGFLLEASPGPIGAGNALKELRNTKVNVIGSCVPGQASALLKAGYIKECVLWNPIDSGYDMVAVANLLLKGVALKDGPMAIPGVGDATIEVEKKIVQLNKLIEITTDNVDQYVAQGL